MMWKGQFNAILILLLVGSCTVSAQTDNAAWVLNTGATVLVVWLVARFANLVSKAVFGFPLIYDHKHITRKTQDGSTTRED
jgi:uncharacterized membrane protein YhdT